MNYAPTQWSTAADKAKFEKQFKKLVNNGFKRSDFPKWFYNRLNSTFGHIAHYDQGGFWDVWFSDIYKQAAFLLHTAQVYICGDPAFTYSDVEKVLQEWVRDSGKLQEYRDKAAAFDLSQRRQQYETLKKEFESA